MDPAGWSIFDAPAAGSSGTPATRSNGSRSRSASTRRADRRTRAPSRRTSPSATIDGRRYAFVGAERGNFVAVYDLSRSDGAEVPPGPAGHQRAGGLAGSSRRRRLFVASSEVDVPEDNVRSTIALFRLAGGPAEFPTICVRDRRRRARSAGAPCRRSPPTRDARSARGRSATATTPRPGCTRSTSAPEAVAAGAGADHPRPHRHRERRSAGRRRRRHSPPADRADSGWPPRVTHRQRPTRSCCSTRKRRCSAGSRCRPTWPPARQPWSRRRRRHRFRQRASRSTSRCRAR